MCAVATTLDWGEQPAARSKPFGRAQLRAGGKRRAAYREALVRNRGGQDLAPPPGSTPGGYERSPLSSFGGLDAECSLPTSVVAAHPGQVQDMYGVQSPGFRPTSFRRPQLTGRCFRNLLAMRELQNYLRAFDVKQFWNWLIYSHLQKRPTESLWIFSPSIV